MEREDENEYQEYFQYVMETLNYRQPENWRDVLQIYEHLTAIAVNSFWIIYTATHGISHNATFQKMP